MRSHIKSGYTLIEILVAVTLMMMLMLGVTQLFSSIGSTLNDTQSTLALTTKIRGVKTRLAKDLTLLTLDPSQTPPTIKGTNKGYLTIIEGMGAGYDKIADNNNNPFTTADIAYNPDSKDNVYDNTVGDTDDIIMFTARAPAGEPFRGKLNGTVIESDTAEIIWFVRGNVLYRRVLLVVPDSELINRVPQGFYVSNDISAHPYYNKSDSNSANWYMEMVANSLDDLGRRENRFAHSAFDSANYAKTFTDNRTNNGPNYFMDRFPFPIHRNAACYFLRMPTVAESTHKDWNAAYSFAGNLDNTDGRVNPFPELMYKQPIYIGNLSAYLIEESGKRDLFSSSFPLKDSGNPTDNHPFIDFWRLVASPWETDTAITAAKSSGNAEVLAIDQITGNVARYIDITETRGSEDVMLANVLSFDVQVWNPDSQTFISLGDPNSVGVLAGWGYYATLPCVYDTWTDDYETAVWDYSGARPIIRTGFGKDQLDNSANNTSNGLVDDIAEWECPPPYAVGLKGVKITIRAFDPESKNVREMTIIQNFGK